MIACWPFRFHCKFPRKFFVMWMFWAELHFILIRCITFRIILKNYTLKISELNCGARIFKTYIKIDVCTCTLFTGPIPSMISPHHLQNISLNRYFSEAIQSGEYTSITSFITLSAFSIIWGAIRAIVPNITISKAGSEKPSKRPAFR